jgi:hypothetical protein
MLAYLAENRKGFSSLVGGFLMHLTLGSLYLWGAFSINSFHNSFFMVMINLKSKPITINRYLRHFLFQRILWPFHRYQSHTISIRRDDIFVQYPIYVWCFTWLLYYIAFNKRIFIVLQIISLQFMNIIIRKTYHFSLGLFRAGFYPLSFYVC